MAETAFLQLLFKTHKSMTLQDPPPSTSIIGLPREVFDEDYTKSTRTAEKIKQAYDLFKLRELDESSVDCDPLFWGTVVFATIRGCADEVFAQFSPRRKVYIAVPNGCCPSRDCPIVLFYNDLVTVLSTTK